MLSQNRHFFFRRRRDKQGGKVAFCSIRPQLPRFDQVFSSSPSFYSHLNVPTESVKTSCFPPCFRQCKLLYLLRNPAKYVAVSFPPLALKGHRVPPLNRKTQTEEGCRRRREETCSSDQVATARSVEAPQLVFAPRLLILLFTETQSGCSWSQYGGGAVPGNCFLPPIPSPSPLVEGDRSLKNLANGV